MTDRYERDPEWPSYDDWAYDRFERWGLNSEGDRDWHEVLAKWVEIDKRRTKARRWYRSRLRDGVCLSGADALGDDLLTLHPNPRYL